MRFLFCTRVLVTISFLGIAILGQSTRGLVIKRPPAGARLVDKSGKTTGEERSRNLDSFFVQIGDSPRSTGYIFVFCGKICSYGEIEAHVKGIENYLESKKYPKDRIVILNAGYRDTQEVEMWLVPQGSCAPVPVSTRSIRDVTFKIPTKPLVEWYDCC